MKACVILVFLAVLARAEEQPKFADYPEEISPLHRLVKAIVPRINSYSRCIRDLPYDRPAVPNFADHYSFWHTGCGTGCGEFCVVDRRDGRVFPGFSFNGAPSYEYIRRSRLVCVEHAAESLYLDTVPVYRDYYLWIGGSFQFLGRWASTVGAVKGGRPDWHREVAFNPNEPSWSENNRQPSEPATAVVAQPSSAGDRTAGG